MLRAPQSEAERLAAEVQLGRARELMIEALTELDGTPVSTNCDARLDHAIHDVTDAMAEVKASASVFTTDAARRREPPESVPCNVD